MTLKTYCKLPVRRIIAVVIIFFVSVGCFTAEAQTKKVVLENFTFYPYTSQESTSNPLVLPYESESNLISIIITESEDYESVQDFLKDYENPLKKSLKIETINGLSLGWVLERSEEEANINILTGMVRNKTTGASLLIAMIYPSKSSASEKNSFAMLRSFRPNAILVEAKPVISNKPPANPVVTNPTANSINSQQILSAHNAYRSELGLPSLTWSEELATFAQAWANELANNRGCQLIHRPYESNSPWSQQYGENIFSGSSPSYTFLDAVKSWGSEKKDFDRKTRKCIGEWYTCGHYTQIIWKSTTQVGCALARCPDGSVIVVCNYNPAGNMTGEPAY